MDGAPGFRLMPASASAGASASASASVCRKPIGPIGPIGPIRPIGLKGTHKIPTLSKF